MPNRLPRTMSREEVQRLLAVPNVKCKTGLRNRTILELLYRSGLRISEALELKPADLKWKLNERGEKVGGYLEVRDSKRGGCRAVPIVPVLAPWLQLWEYHRPEDAEYFFCSVRGRRMWQQYVRQLMGRLAEKAGLDPSHVSPHILRHTFATELLEEGFSLVDIGHLLGHRSITTTQIYLHIRPDDLAERMEQREGGLALEPLDPKVEQMSQEQRIEYLGATLRADLGPEGANELKKVLGRLDRKHKGLRPRPEPTQGEPTN